MSISNEKGNIYCQTGPHMKTDVLVCGGGPSGIAAAWGAAHAGAKVILAERNEFLGGTPVSCLVATMGYGAHDKERWVIGGFFKEFRNRMITAGYLTPTKRKGWEPINVEGFKLVAFEMLEEIGVDIQCGLLAMGVEIQEDSITQVIFRSKLATNVIQGKYFIDATGDGDIGYYSGCTYEVGRTENHGEQPGTLCYLLGNVDIEKVGEWLTLKGRRGYWIKDDRSSYINMTGLQEEVSRAFQEETLKIQRDHVASVYSIPGMTGVVGVNFGRIFLCDGNIGRRYMEGVRQAREGMEFFKRYIPGFEACELIATAPQVGIRTSRRIKGLYTITKEDLLNLSQFEDVIAQGCYMIDIHSPESKGTTQIKIPKGKHYDIALRSIVSAERSNLFLAGRCISADFSAISALRIQPICMASGHASGIAAAISCQTGEDGRKLNYKNVQQELLSQGGILD